MAPVATPRGGDEFEPHNKVIELMDNGPSVAYFENCDGMCCETSGEDLERVVG